MGNDSKWVWKDDGNNLGAWECPYCNDITHYSYNRMDEVKRIYTCECGKKFEFMWDTCSDGEGGSNLVVAITKEV